MSSEQTAPDGAADSISPDDEYHCDQMAEVTLDVLTSPIKTLGNRPTVTVTPGNKPVALRLLSKSYVVSAEIAYKRGFEDGMARAAGMVVRHAVSKLGEGSDPLTADRLGEYADALCEPGRGPDHPDVLAVKEKHKGDPEFVRLSDTYADLWRKTQEEYARKEAENTPADPT